MKKGMAIGSVAKIIFILLVLFILYNILNGLYGQTFNEGIKKFLGEKTESEITHEQNIQVKNDFENLKEQIEKCQKSQKEILEIFDENKFINYEELNKYNKDTGKIISDESKKQNIDPVLISALIRKESSFDPNAVSICGGAGLMQLMPDSARDIGLKVPNYNQINVQGCNTAYECNQGDKSKCKTITEDERFNPTKNVYAGIKYLKQKIDKYNNNYRLALAAYNAGDVSNKDSTYCVGKKLWECEQNKDYEQTRNHVEKTTDYYDEYKNIFYTKKEIPLKINEPCGCLVNLNKFNQDYQLKFNDKEIRLLAIRNIRENEEGLQMASFDIKLNCYWDNSFIKENPFTTMIFIPEPLIVKEIKFWKDSKYKFPYKFNILKINDKLCWLTDNVDENKIKDLKACQ